VTYSRGIQESGNHTKRGVHLYREAISHGMLVRLCDEQPVYESDVRQVSKHCRCLRCKSLSRRI
jgi:hypothetical protein